MTDRSKLLALAEDLVGNGQILKTKSLQLRAGSEQLVIQPAAAFAVGQMMIDAAEIVLAQAEALS